jgi:hypothetical protein
MQPAKSTEKGFPGWYEVEVNLQPTVSRPVCLGVRHPSGIRDQFFFLLEISFRQLRVCYFVAPSLTRGRVCNLLYNWLWVLPEQSLLGPSSAEPTTIFYCLIWDSPNLEGQVPVFISPRNRVAQLYPQALGSFFVAPYDSQGYDGGILTRPHTGPDGMDFEYVHEECTNVIILMSCKITWKTLLLLIGPW